MDILIGFVFLSLYLVACTVAFYANELYVADSVGQRSASKKFASFVIVALITACLSIFIGTYSKSYESDLGSLLFLLALCNLLLLPLVTGFSIGRKYPVAGSGAFLAVFVSPWVAVFIFLVSENVG